MTSFIYSRGFNTGGRSFIIVFCFINCNLLPYFCLYGPQSLCFA